MSTPKQYRVTEFITNNLMYYNFILIASFLLHIYFLQSNSGCTVNSYINYIYIQNKRQESQHFALQGKKMNDKTFQLHKEYTLNISAHSVERLRSINNDKFDFNRVSSSVITKQIWYNQASKENTLKITPKSFEHLRSSCNNKF